MLIFLELEYLIYKSTTLIVNSFFVHFLHVHKTPLRLKPKWRGWEEIPNYNIAQRGGQFLIDFGKLDDFISDIKIGYPNQLSDLIIRVGR